MYVCKLNFYFIIVQIYNDLNKLSATKPVITIGIFDGVHKGHTKIINNLIDISSKINGESVVLTFWPHPQYVINNYKDEIKLLTTIEEKIILLKEAGVDNLIIYPFTKELSLMRSRSFVEQILVKMLNIHTLVVGYDNHIGKNKDGNYEQLKEYAKEFKFDIIKIEEEQVDNINVSSTKIRNAIISGDIDKANLFLGYNYSITGKVVEGKNIGITLGFPTANIELEEYKLIPVNGVYAVDVFYNDKSYLGMLNIGIRPTFENKDKSTSIEIHIFDFNKNIYGENLTVTFLKKLREEVKFDNVEQLIAQLFKDKEMVLKLYTHKT